MRMFTLLVAPARFPAPARRAVDALFRPRDCGTLGEVVSIVVMGISGSGKSSVGMALARRLQVPFADADTFHSAANIAKMSAGVALGDDDRLPWLDAVGEWLREHDAPGGVIGCSALKRGYRDRLRRYRGDLEFLHLTGAPELIRRRQARRAGHFMPAALVQSQLDTLEPLQSDERGVTVDIGDDPDRIVENYLARRTHLGGAW